MEKENNKMNEQYTKRDIGRMRHQIQRRDLRISLLITEIKQLKLRIEKLEIAKQSTPKKIEDIIHDVVTTYHPVQWDEIRGRSRLRPIVIARHLHQFLLYKYSNYSLMTIGEITGNRHYSTVIHAKQTILDLKDTDRNFCREVEDIQNRINELIK